MPRRRRPTRIRRRSPLPSWSSSPGRSLHRRSGPGPGRRPDRLPTIDVSRSRSSSCCAAIGDGHGGPRAASKGPGFRPRRRGIAHRVWRTVNLSSPEAPVRHRIVIHRRRQSNRQYCTYHPDRSQDLRGHVIGPDRASIDPRRHRRPPGRRHDAGLPGRIGRRSAASRSCRLTRSPITDS